MSPEPVELLPLVVFGCGQPDCSCWGWTCRVCLSHSTRTFATDDEATLAALAHGECETAERLRAAAREWAAGIVELRA